MKTLLFITALFIGSVVNGQNGYASVQIRSISDTVLVGDSIDVRFTYTTSVNPNKTMVQVMFVNPGVYSYDVLNDYYASNAVSLLPIDSNGYRVLKIKTTSQMGTGACKMYSNSTVGGYLNFYIKQVSQVGVNEYDKNATITKVEYFDIYGKEKPSHNEGLTIKITTYSNGYQKKEKVILSLQ